MDHEEENILGALLSLIGEAATCICGKSECENHRNVALVEDLSNQSDDHKRLHQALERLDCATVCKLLCSGMELCHLGGENCFSIIVKLWTSTFLNSALKLYPSAIKCRGSKGETLLMLCETSEKFQIVLSHGADVNATNDDGESVLSYNVKNRPGQVEEIFIRDYFSVGIPKQEIRLENMEYKWKDLMRLILNSGVDMDAEDNKGQTAFQLLLNVFKQYYCFPGESVIHINMMCYFGNKIASSFLSLLLEAGAKLPPPDQHGRTPLMLAVQSPSNFENVRTLIERGVDVNAVDVHGNNAIYHLLESTVQHKKISRNRIVCNFDFPVVDQMVSFLLDHGCHMQGTDLLMSEYKDDCVKYKIVNHLMAMKGSTLRERDFSQKLEAKNDPTNLSFLSVYLLSRVIDRFCFVFKSSDVAIIEQEIANGLDVNCGAHGYSVRPRKARVWKKRLCLPFPLLITMGCKLKHLTVFQQDSEKDSLIMELQEKYQAVEDTQKLLLAFWPHPPLALLLFDQPHKDEPNQGILLRKRLMQFLHEVGGPLSPASEIYLAVKETLASNAEERPARGELLPLFHQLHYKVPSLFQLSRTALRSSLKKTDTKGLDVSSLRALCEGEMRPLPPDIVDLINFKKSSVSEMKVVPEMVYYL